MVAAVAAVGIGVAAFMYWRGDNGDFAQFCALYNEEGSGAALSADDLEQGLVELRKAAPRSVKADIGNQLAFIREEPELNRLVMDPGAAQALTPAEQQQFLNDLKDAFAKYDMEGSIKRVRNEAARCPNAN
ncbi:MAG: hypothetical protein LBC97_16500 [Bifidobacteriaceae bacterium]|nr:hypothetical protein [Bifidobacteriaceae bacterium]